MPTFSNKGGRRYYYYLCSKDAKRGTTECPVKQIPSGDIETLVRKQLQKMLSDISLVMRFGWKQYNFFDFSFDFQILSVILWLVNNN